MTHATSVFMRIKNTLWSYTKALFSCIRRTHPIGVDPREELKTIQSRIAINALLETAFSRLSLERQLEVALEIILTVPWLSFVHKGAIFLLDKNEQVLRLTANINMSDAQIPCHAVGTDQCLCGRNDTSASILCRGCITQEHTISYNNTDLDGYYCIPILEGSNLIGVLNLHASTGHTLNRDMDNFLSVSAGILTNLIELRRAEQSIDDEITFSNTILDTTTSYIIILDTAGRIITVNNACRINLGYESDEVVGHFLWEFFAREEEIQSIRERIESISSGINIEKYNGYWMKTKQGIERLIELNKASVSTSRYGKIIICTGNDITEQRAYINILHYSSTHDKLTDTLNRQEMIIILTQLSRSKRRENNVIVMVDIDYFRNINNTYGHLTGDKVLVSFSIFLKNSMREQDKIFRYGGEEFLILIRNISLSDAHDLVARICKNLVATPIDIGEKGYVTITASFGLAPLVSGVEIEKSISNADKALYDAKNGGRNRVCVYGGG